MGRLAEELVAPDEAQTIAAFTAFLKRAVDRRAAETGEARRRFNQTRAAGCLAAEFTVPADLVDGLKVGLFAHPGTYTARIRFANANSAKDSEPDIRGMAIKVLGVPEENLTPGCTDQDFVLNSHPVMMASDAKGFLGFLEAVEKGGVAMAGYFATHPKALRVVTKARRHHSCHLDLRYWSATPYLFGNARAIKYGVWPTGATRSPEPGHRPSDTYLTDALIARLAGEDATFNLGVQFQTDATQMPIEDAMVEWPEEMSPFRTVATIRIPKQRFDRAEDWQACERQRFNPWNALVAHRPLGSMNRARRTIYAALGDYRG